MIDKELNKELKERFNPEGSILRKIQIRELEVLEYIDSVCQENNISYWLSSGNVLGMERHGGFIPWDDDIDIELPRKDYKKLLKILKKKSLGSDYQLQNWNNDRYYLLFFAKLRDKKSSVHEKYTDLYKYNGIYVDIFQMGKSNRWLVKKSTNFRCRANAYIYNHFSNIIARKIMLLILKFFLIFCFYPTLYILGIIFGDSKKLYTIPSGVGSDFYGRSVDNIFPLKRMKFEGIEVNVPNNITGYLSELYGDYNKLPEFEDIMPHFNSNNVTI